MSDKFNLMDFSTWGLCEPYLNKKLKYKGKIILKAETYKPITIKEFIGFMCVNYEFLSKAKDLSLVEKNTSIRVVLEKMFLFQTDKKKMKKAAAEYKENQKKEQVKLDEESKKTDEKFGIIPSEMSGYKVSGHELTLAQYTLLYGFFKLEENKIKQIVDTFYNGAKDKKAGYQIRQDLFSLALNIDIDFIFYIMRADIYAEEKKVFIEFLPEWVSEIETAAELEKVFDLDYFGKHPEIRQEVLENSYGWKLENNKLVRTE